MSLPPSAKTQKALAVALSLKNKTQEKAHGGKCYACGGVVSDDTEMSEGGGLEDSLLDIDNDELVHPEEIEAPSEDASAQPDRSNFLRAYMMSRKIRSPE